MDVRDHAHYTQSYVHVEFAVIPYSRKYWRELNLAVEPQIAITRILVDLNLAAWYGTAIRMYASRKFGGCNIDCQTAKFNSLLNFPAIW